MMMARYRDFDRTFEHKGRQFGMTIEFDAGLQEPWKEHDGHGIVSEWTSRAKRAGERVLVQDRSSYRYYNFAETMKLARKDSWGVSDPKEGETKRQQLVRAVEKDFEHLRAWCNDGWHWCGVIVELLDSDGERTGETESLWGMENSDTKYLEMEAHELADAIIYRVDKDFVEASELERPDLYSA
jgi:hypothetical protein